MLSSLTCVHKLLYLCTLSVFCNDQSLGLHLSPEGCKLLSLSHIVYAACICSSLFCFLQTCSICGDVTYVIADCTLNVCFCNINIFATSIFLQRKYCCIMWPTLALQQFTWFSESVSTSLDIDSNLDPPTWCFGLRGHKHVTLKSWCSHQTPADLSIQHLLLMPMTQIQLWMCTQTHTGFLWKFQRGNVTREAQMLVFFLHTSEVSQHF